MNRLVQASVFGAAALAGWLGKQAWPPSETLVPANSPPPPATVFRPDERGDTITTAEAVANDLSAPDPAPAGAVAARLLEAQSTDRRIWAVVFSAWCATDAEEAWTFAQGSSEALPGINLPDIALEQWAMADPGAARAALHDPTEEQLAALLEGAMAANIEAGFALLEALLADGANAARIFKSNWWIRERRLEALALSNPQAALAWADRLDHSDLLGPVVSGWWKHDPIAARHWLNQQANREDLLRQLGEFIAHHANSYRPELMDLVHTALPPGNRKSEMIQQAMEALAYADPDLAVTEANRILPDPAIKAEAIGKIASIVAKTDFHKAWDILGHLDPSVLDIRRVSLPRIEISEQGAVENIHGPFHYAWDLTSMRGLVSPGEIKSGMLADLIMVDKDQALEFMAGLPPGQLARVCRDSIERWGWYDPEDAATWLAGKLGDAGDADDVRDWFSESALEGDALRSLIIALPAGTVRTALSTDAAVTLAGHDPLAALDFARQAGAPAEAVAEVYDDWSSTDPEKALEHLATDHDAPAEAWRCVVRHAFGKIPDETARMVASLPAGKPRDTAISQIVKQALTGPDPVPAAQWALDIGDATMRRKAVESVLARTAVDLRLARDQELAGSLRELIASNPTLTGDERTRWLGRIATEFPGP